MEGKEKIKTPKEMTEYEFLSTIYGETELLGEVHSKMIVRSIAELLEQRFEVVNEDVATIKSDNSKVIAALQAKLEKAKELLREARDWMKEEASIKMRNGANRDVVDSYDDKAYKLTTFLEAKCGSDCPCTNIELKKSGRCRN